VRFLALLGGVLVIALLTRFNGCDRASVVGELARSLAATDASVQAMRSEIAAVAVSAQSADARLGQILAAEHRVVYAFDPRRDDHPDGEQLAVLRSYVKAGAEVRVVSRPAIGGSSVDNLACIAAHVDDSGNVYCTGPERPSNLLLPDGRRYQETIRHDGSIFFTHWDATGSNVQGQREMGQWATTWLVRGPIDAPAPAIEAPAHQPPHHPTAEPTPAL
jgi:hypothetical protein